MKTFHVISALVCFIYLPALAQNKPYQNGTYDFGIFNAEYGRTTARCNLIISGDHVTAIITKNLYEDIYDINDIAFKGRIVKNGSYYYLFEDGIKYLSNEDIEYQAARIDFKRKFIIHN